MTYGNSFDLTSVPTSLLPRNSTVVTESPYFAYVALQLEEKFTQNETQLWSEVLKLLAATVGKPSIDSAVKVSSLDDYISFKNARHKIRDVSESV